MALHLRGMRYALRSNENRWYSDCYCAVIGRGSMSFGGISGVTALAETKGKPFAGPNK